MHVWGQRDKGNLYFPVNFAADLKLPLKNNSLGGRSQDGGGIGRGDHFLSYKFIERTIER